MKKIIMIRYGELSTKKDNIKYFLDSLESNIKKVLLKNKIKITKYKSRMYIDYFFDEEENIIQKLSKVPGIIGYSISYIIKTDIDEISNNIIDLLSQREFSTFKVTTKRTYKAFKYNTPEINNIVGGNILKSLNKKVDVHNPEINVTIEVRDKEYTYIYFNEYKGLGGYPIGSNGRAMVMLSGGIDSPVAAYLALRRGVAIDTIYFEAIPHTSINARNKVIELCKILNEYSKDINLYIIPFTKIQESIYKNIDKSYTITIMRRMMYRITENLCKKLDIKMIINGESIGQVSSQTISNMYVINNVTNMPIIRPLACMDKIEIIDISNKINTYNTSILPYEDCCTVFVPDHPVLTPTIEKCEFEESKIEYNTLIDDAIKNINTINISKQHNFEDLL